MSRAASRMPQCVEQLPPRRIQLRLMAHREAAQNTFTFRRQPKQHLPAVVLASRSFAQVGDLEPICELYGAMMLNLQPFRQHANGRLLAVRKSLNHQQRLMLLGLNSSLARGTFAEIEEPPEFISESRQSLIIQCSHRPNRAFARLF